eukprot:PhF_6_TR41715/c0_g1_i1/m.63293
MTQAQQQVLNQSLSEDLGSQPLQLTGPKSARYLHRNSTARKISLPSAGLARRTSSGMYSATSVGSDSEDGNAADNAATTANDLEWWLENRRRIIMYHFLEGTNTEPSLARWQTVYMCFNISMILASTISFILDSLPMFYLEERELRIGTPLFIVDAICVLYFTIELFLRWIVFPRRRAQTRFWNTFNLIDLISILGFYVELMTLIIAANSTQLKLQGIVVLRVVRLVRLARVMKLSRYNNTFVLVVRVMNSSTESLLLLTFLLSVAVVLFSTLAFFAENWTEATYNSELRRWEYEPDVPSAFQSIPDTFWYTFVTVSTVGYGDRTPRSIAGKVVSGGIMMFGLLCLSLPTILIAANFATVHRKHHMMRARASLGRMFRKARIVIIVVKAVMRERFDPATLFVKKVVDDPDDDATEMAIESVKADVVQRRTNVTRRIMNFAFGFADFREIDWKTYGKPTNGTCATWSVKGVTALQIFIPLMCTFSGVACVDELRVVLSRCNYPLRNVTNADIFECCLVLAYHNCINMFILNRVNHTAVVGLTLRALTMMEKYGENDVYHIPCTRNQAEAAEIYSCTTGKKHYLDVTGKLNYKIWSSIEKTVAKRIPGVDMTFDYRANPQGLANDLDVFQKDTKDAFSDFVETGLMRNPELMKLRWKYVRFKARLVEQKHIMRCLGLEVANKNAVRMADDWTKAL